MKKSDTQVLREAADLIDRYGLAQHTLGDRTVGFCAIGAINAALNGATHGYYDYRTMNRTETILRGTVTALRLRGYERGSLSDSDAVSAVADWSNGGTQASVSAGLREVADALEARP